MTSLAREAGRPGLGGGGQAPTSFARSREIGGRAHRPVPAPAGMSGPPGLRPRLLLVGGGGGLVGRALLREFAPDWQIRSVHRHSTPEESDPVGRMGAGRRGHASELASRAGWGGRGHQRGVVPLGPDRRFRPLAEGLRRLVADARAVGVRRFVQISVPIATDHIETTLPYMVRKREVDRAIVESGIPYTLVRPTMLFGPRDVLLTVMLRTMARWHRFPIFEEGEYPVSPISVRDLARIVRREASLDGARTVTAGGPGPGGTASSPTACSRRSGYRRDTSGSRPAAESGSRTCWRPWGPRSCMPTRWNGWSRTGSACLRTRAWTPRSSRWSRSWTARGCGYGPVGRTGRFKAGTHPSSRRWKQST